MKSALTTGGVIVIMFQLSGWGCSTTPGDSLVNAPVATTVAATISAPMELSGDIDSNWVYLAQKYDSDGDGRIDPGEYSRAGGQFERLDRDEDGALTAEDFRRGRGGGMDPAQMRLMVTQRLMMSYFQDDDDPDRLALAELEQAIAGYDSNGDDALSGAEFTNAAEDRLARGQEVNARMMRMMMQDKTPWEALLEGLDKDQNQLIAQDEVIAFFKERDDGDLVWSMGGRRQARRGSGQRASAGTGESEVRQEPTDGAMEGKMAPDFTLTRLHSDEQVSLSAFQGNLPVALIFGSYT